MSIIEDQGELRIEGEGSERARIAYASEEEGRLTFTLAPTLTPSEYPGILPS
jgi:hypothetical protein